MLNIGSKTKFWIILFEIRIQRLQLVNLPRYFYRSKSYVSGVQFQTQRAVNINGCIDNEKKYRYKSQQI